MSTPSPTLTRVTFFLDDFVFSGFGFLFGNWRSGFSSISSSFSYMDVGRVRRRKTGTFYLLITKFYMGVGVLTEPRPER